MLHGETQRKRWAFTLSNAGAWYCESRYDLAHLSDIDWAAVNATNWSQCKEGKQAEFLVEQQFPWELVSRIGVYSQAVCSQVLELLSATKHNLIVELKPELSTPEYSVPPLPEHSVPMIPEQYVPPVPE